MLSISLHTSSTHLLIVHPENLCCSIIPLPPVSLAGRPSAQQFACAPGLSTSIIKAYCSLCAFPQVINGATRARQRHGDPWLGASWTLLPA